VPLFLFGIAVELTVCYRRSFHKFYQFSDLLDFGEEGFEQNDFDGNTSDAVFEYAELANQYSG
jgi:hypothetical protein